MNARGAAIEVRISMEQGGLRLEYLLPHPVTSFHFGPEEHLSEAADIRLLAPGLEIVDGAVVSSSPFAGFAISIRPDTERRDATYPALASVGEHGYLLYLPVLSPDPALGPMRIHFDAADGSAVVRGSSDNGFVFIGPRSYVSRDDTLTTVAPPGLPASLASTVRRSGAELLDYYEAQLGRPSGTPPIVIVSYDQAESGAGFVGDVTPNGVVLIQLSAAIDALPGGGEAIVSRFLAHEFFHLWNSPLYGELEDLNGHWLREGAAEYASWLAAKALWPGGDSLEERLTAQLAPCIVTLGDDALVELRDQRAQTSRYSCGSIASWLTDVALRRAGQGDFFTLWRSILAGGRSYDVRTFEAAVAERAAASAEPLRSLLRGHGIGRWPHMFHTLQSAGVIVEEVPPGAAALRGAALQTLLREACTAGTVGFETLGLTEPPRAIILRTEPMGDDTAPTGCGPLAGDPELLAIDGRRPLADWDEILLGIGAACDRGGAVEVTIRRGELTETVSIRCSTPALVPATQYRVRRALPS